MSGFSKMIAFLSGSTRFKIYFMLFLCWAVFYLICYLFGGLGLSALGRKRRVKGRLLAWVPVAQVLSELRLVQAKDDEKQVSLLLWWWLALDALGLTCGVWGLLASFIWPAIVRHLLLVLMGLFLLLGLWAYIRMRIIEFQTLRYLFRKNPKFWVISICGTALGLPLQRLFLYVIRKDKI